MATYTKVYDYFKRVFRKEYINKYIANTEKTIYVTGPTKSECSPQHVWDVYRFYQC